MISSSIIEAVKEYLGSEGVEFFKSLKKEHGEVSPVIMMGKIPHSVHLNEGMHIRNFLRTLSECSDWDCHKLDNTWASIIEEIIEN